MIRTTSLLGRLMWTFVSLSLVVVMLSGCIAWLEFRREIHVSLIKRLEKTVDEKSMEIGSWLEGKKSQAAVLAADPVVCASMEELSLRPGDQDELDVLNERLADLTALQTDISEVFVALPNQSVSLASSVEGHAGGEIPEARAWGSREPDEPSVLMLRDAGSGGQALSVACPITDGARTIGMLCIKIYTQNLLRLMQARAGLPPGGEIFFMDRPEYLASAKGPGTHDRKSLSGDIFSGSYKNYEGLKVFGAMKYVDPPGLVLCAEIRSASTLAAASRVTLTVILTGLMLSAFLTLGIYFASRRITRPILAVTEAAEAVAQGDMTRKAPVMGRDQIGRLALTFNWMTDQLQALYADMREKVSQLQEARDVIAAKERYFRALIENANDLICIMNENGRITYVSPSVFRIIGFASEEVEGTSVFYWFVEEDGKKLREMLPRMLAKQGILRMADYRVRHRNGGQRILEMYGTNLLKDPDVKGFIINARDVTDRHKYLEELGRIEKLESIGVLAGGIAHDFNNMLTGILGNVSLARLKASKDPAVGGRLREAEKAILAARELTQQLLTFSGGGAPLTESASLDALLKESVGFALSGGKVACEYDLPANLWPVEVDPGQIRQVVHNLVLNAVHAQGGMGAIRISAENLEIEEEDAPGLPLSPGRYVAVRISDEGHGIAEKNLPRIFDPYFTTKKDGSGLGLAVTFQIIARHHGHIAVTSSPGEGSTFHIYLPASDDLPVVMKEVPAVQVAGRGERILVMDDEAAVLEVTGAMLEYMGFSVETARDGQEAVDAYRRASEKGEPFRAVIMDLNVAGGMGGKEAITKILAFDPRAVGVVSSGYCHDPIMSEYSRYGFSGVIAKPYTPEKLFTVIEQVLKKPRPPQAPAATE